MTVGEAMRDERTVLGRAAKAHSEMIRRVAAMTPEEQERFWREAARATR